MWDKKLGYCRTLEINFGQLEDLLDFRVEFYDEQSTEELRGVKDFQLVSVSDKKLQVQLNFY